jgi:hypothetical protein
VKNDTQNNSGTKALIIVAEIAGIIVIPLAVWLVVPALLGLFWLAVAWITPGFGVARQSFSLLVHSFYNWGGAGLWAYTTVAALVAVIVLGSSGFVEETSTVHGIRRFFLTTVTVLTSGIFVLSAVQAVRLGINSDKNQAKWYDSSLVVYTPSLSNPPASLHYLMNNVVKDPSGRCAFINKADVPVCVKKGTLPLAGFEARVSSAAGATIVMQRTSGTRQNVELLTSTLTYLNAMGKSGVWSAIRDGSGSWQPTEGVVEWTGQGNPTECQFNQRGVAHDSFNMAINGSRRNSLTNYLASTFPHVYFNKSDVWGYCQGPRPLLVFPVQEQVRHLGVVSSAPAGVLLVTGSSSGTPKVTYVKHPTNLPGPSYPKSVAQTQRVNINWAAGRAKTERGLFGFEPTNSTAQAGNVSEYLLKSVSDGHLYWVTPLTLTSSSSQLFVAYSMVRADTVTPGHLNTMKLYVMASNDPRVTNIDTLVAQARNYMSQAVSGFISSGGSVLEFTPTTGDLWRGFAEMNGRVVYRLDISTTTSLVTKLVNIDPSGSTSVVAPSAPTTAPSVPSGGLPTAGNNALCGKDPSSLSQAQNIACMKVFAGSIK